jgi:hypothetical protein
MTDRLGGPDDEKGTNGADEQARYRLVRTFKTGAVV